MAPRARCPHPLVLTSLALVLSCGAPAGEDEDSLPEYAGARPGAAPGSAPLPASTPAGAAPSGTPTSGTPESIGNSPSGVPIAGGSGSAAPSSSSSSAAPTSPAAAGGSGGSAGIAPTPDDGVGGSAMPGVAGNGATPPPDDVTPPPADVTPPPVTPAPVSNRGSGCATGPQLFCEDFDAAPLGALQGTLDGLRPERTVSIIDEPGRGRVLQVQSGVTYDNKSGVFLDNFSAPNGSHFGRAFIRVGQFPNAGGDHWVVVETTSSAGGDNVRPAGGQFSRWAPGADGSSAGDWTDWQQSNAETVPGEWECVEWQIDTANGGNDMLLWVNGLEVQPLDRGNFRIPAIDSVWFGFVVYQSTQPPTYDVRFDDIVLSTERVGCN